MMDTDWSDVEMSDIWITDLQDGRYAYRWQGESEYIGVCLQMVLMSNGIVKSPLPGRLDIGPIHLRIVGFKFPDILVCRVVDEP